MGLAVSAAQLIVTEEAPQPPHPYSFSYAAGRAPGHVDRVHSETSDGSGVVKGMHVPLNLGTTAVHKENNLFMRDLSFFSLFERVTTEKIPLLLAKKDECLYGIDKSLQKYKF